MARVLIAESLDAEGVELLKGQADLKVDVKTGLSHDELVRSVADYEALIVRSGAQVTEEVIRAGKNLQVVARAGVGVDNIDLDAATANGIAVVNAPTGNTIAAVEHTLALMLALSRNVPQAHESLRGGAWSRSAFIGVEIRNKALGIVGLGRVGSEVARRAQSFSMRVLGYDPFINPEAARLLGIELTSLDNLFAESDFITLHTPLTPGTQNLINEESLAKVKPGARLINVARGELVDSEAVRKALDENRLAGAAVDVFPTEPPGDDEPLINHPKVIATPHLGAYTREAQREVAVEVAEQVIAVLSGVSARNTVNAPFMPPEVHAVVAPFIPVADILGRLVTSLAEGQFRGVTIGYQGEIANHDTTPADFDCPNRASETGHGRPCEPNQRTPHRPTPRMEGQREQRLSPPPPRKPYHCDSGHDRGRAYPSWNVTARRGASGQGGRILAGTSPLTGVHYLLFVGAARQARLHRRSGSHSRAERHQHQLHAGGEAESPRTGDDDNRSGRPCPAARSRTDYALGPNRHSQACAPLSKEAHYGTFGRQGGICFGRS